LVLAKCGSQIIERTADLTGAAVAASIQKINKTVESTRLVLDAVPPTISGFELISQFGACRSIFGFDGKIIRAKSMLRWI
jgi:hypothetical protein